MWNLRRRRRHSPPQLLSRDLFERMLGERPPSQHCEPKWMDRSPVIGIVSFHHVDTSPHKNIRSVATQTNAIKAEGTLCKAAAAARKKGKREREEEKRNLTPPKPVQEEGKESSTVETPIKISMHKITLDARSLVSSLFTKCIGAPNAYVNVCLTEEDEVCIWKVRIARAPSLLCVTCFNRLSLSRT